MHVCSKPGPAHFANDGARVWSSGGKFPRTPSRALRLEEGKNIMCMKSPISAHPRIRSSRQAAKDLWSGVLLRMAYSCSRFQSRAVCLRRSWSLFFSPSAACPSPRSSPPLLVIAPTCLLRLLGFFYLVLSRSRCTVTLVASVF